MTNEPVDDLADRRGHEESEAAAPTRRGPAVWVAYAMLAATGSLVVLEAVLSSASDLVALLLPFSFLVVGAFVALRQPRNVEAQLLLGTGLAWAVALAVPFDGSWVIPLALMTTHLLLRFPDGELPSRRWRPFSWFCVVMPIVVAIVVTTGSEVLEAGGSNPYYVSWTVALTPVIVLLPIAMVVSVVSLVIRYRRSGSVQRHQVRWIAFAGAWIVIIWGLTLVVSLAFDQTQGANSTDRSWFDPVYPTWLLALQMAALLSFLLIPISFGIAIARFRLYEIDVIISRSITFGVLAVLIGGVYVGIVVGFGRVFGQADGSNTGLSIAATAVVALGFGTARNGVEGWANRLVYGKRATPYEVLARFSHRATDESDGEVVSRIPRLIVDGTAASKAVVWVRTVDGFEATSTWPESHSSRVLPDVEPFDDPESDLSLPVFHDGELLGGISLIAARGGVITPPERELLSRLADGLGLTLRNGNLTATLRRQVKDLQRSRDRVVSVADEARRSLEHDLDSGPQQQLVAVKVKLGPVRKLAEQAGAERTASVLGDIEVQVGDALQAVRDFAAGIYPPLLGAEGLGVALAHETQKAALPVEVDVDGLGRYPRAVESAVYFSILEALQNTAKYAEASRAVVSLSEVDGDLRFEVRDDGEGFDTATVARGVGLNGIADRIDTIGGSWSIVSRPSGGTVVSGSVPITDGAITDGAVADGVVA